MSRKDDKNIKPGTPWYQNIIIVISWTWAGVNLLPIFLSSLGKFAILSLWITWPITIVGTLLVGGVIFGAPIYLKKSGIKVKNLETGKNKRIKSLDSKTLFMSLGILIALWIPRASEYYVPPKQGNVRIAIADFIILDKSIPSSVSQDISQQIYQEIEKNILNVESEYGKLKIEVLPPNRTPNIVGITPEEIEANIESISRKIEADIIVYGVITKGIAESSADVEPFFFLAENSVFGFPEFVGQDTWTTKFNYVYDNGIDSSLQRDILAESLSRRTKALIYSIYGAWKYRNGIYKDSAALFEKATQVSSIEDTKGLSVWYLWWGNAVLKQGDYENAYQYYQTALDYRPGYARAFIGLAETTVSQTNDLLSTTGLSNAEDFIDTTNIFLKNAMNATDRPASADIDIKAEFILGKIAQMNYVFLLPDPKYLEEAEMHYKVVTSNRTNKRIAEQVGLSFMHLGEIYMARHEYTLAYINFNSALEFLQDTHAIELTRSNLALLPVLAPVIAKEQLATAKAMSTDDNTDKEYQRRIECLNLLPTSVPQNELICP